MARLESGDVLVEDGESRPADIIWRGEERRRKRLGLAKDGRGWTDGRTTSAAAVEIVLEEDGV